MSEGILISPVPKEYASYSNQEKIEKTEAYYRKMDDIYSRMDTFEDEYRKRIEHLLQNNADAAAINSVLTEKDAQLLCHCSYQFVVLKSFCRIAESEEYFKEPCILQNFQTMAEAVWWRHNCVFLLRRFEFDWEETDELLMFMQNEKLSYICIAEIICENWIVRKIHTASNISYYLYKNGRKREAVLLLMRLEQMLPYSEKMIMTFSMTLLDMREFRLAYEVLLKYQNPNSDIKEMQEELGRIVLGE